MSSTVLYTHNHNGASTPSSDNSRPASDVPQPMDVSSVPEPADSMLNTSNDSNDDDAHTDAQLLSASILATIQSTPRHHATPPSRTPNSSSKSTPYLNGHSTHDSYDSFNSRDEEDHKDGRRNGKTNNNMYPPSPTANITPRRRSTRVDNEREKPKEREKEKEKKGTDTPSSASKRDNKNVSGSATKRARKRLAAANEADMPQPVAVLGRNLDLTTLKTGEDNAENDVFADPNWAESISLYSLARSWMCSGVDLDPFHILRHDTAESVLLDMHDYIPPPALPPPSTTAPPALPERPRYPSSNEESFQSALKKGCDNTPRTLLKSYVANCKTFRTWWKANYTQRLSKYKGRLAILFPSSEQSQSSSSSSRHTQHTHTNTHSNPHPRTPSPPPRQSAVPHTHRTPSPPPRQLPSSQQRRTQPPQQSPDSHSSSQPQSSTASQQMPPPPQPPQHAHHPDQAPRAESPVPRSQSPVPPQSPSQPRSQSPVPPQPQSPSQPSSSSSSQPRSQSPVPQQTPSPSSVQQT